MPRWDCRISGFNLEFPILELYCASATSRLYQRSTVQLGLSMFTSKTFIAPITGTVGSVFEDAGSWARAIATARGVIRAAFSQSFRCKAVSVKPSNRHYWRSMNVSSGMVHRGLVTTWTKEGLGPDSVQRLWMSG